MDSGAKRGEEVKIFSLAAGTTKRALGIRKSNQNCDWGAGNARENSGNKGSDVLCQERECKVVRTRVGQG